MTTQQLLKIYDRIYDAHGGAWPDFEELIRRILRAVVRPGDCAIDGGANVGEVTEFLAELVGPSGNVVSLEPAPEVYGQLLARIQTKSLAGIVRPHQVALADRAGESSFVFVPQLHGYSGLQVRDYPFEVQTQLISVSTIRMDQLLPLPGDLSFIKLDLEGGEYHALRGGEQILRKYRPFVVFEHGGNPTYQRYGYEGEDLSSYFEGLGYILFDVVGNELSERAVLDLAKVYYFFAAHPAHRRYDVFLAAMRELAESLVGQSDN
jgi:FkbM family methyltransferase